MSQPVRVASLILQTLTLRDQLMQYLDVPWEEKESAKRMGAKWDAPAKCWFVPEGVEPSPFQRWALQAAADQVGLASQFAIHADRFAILNGTMACWACKKPTQVSAIFLEGYSEPDDELGDRVQCAEKAVVQGIVGLNSNVTALIKQHAPWMRPGYSKTRDQTYLAPHCQHCAALQGAWFLSEPGAPFFPQTPQEAAHLEVLWFETSIEVDGDPSWSSWTDWLPRQ